MAEVREAFELLKLWPDANYLRNAYYTTTQIFREMGVYDSAFYYNNLWSAINDSLEKVVATSSLAITKARLNDETSRYNIQILNKEKRSQVMFRNILIVGIVLLSVIGLLYLNRSRIKLHYKEQTAKAEVKSAKEQLQLFTQNIIEKTELVERLQQQLLTKELDHEQQELIVELSRTTILTEEDWEKFKTNFEKIYPGFFQKAYAFIC